MESYVTIHVLWPFPGEHVQKPDEMERFCKLSLVQISFQEKAVTFGLAGPSHQLLVVSQDIPNTESLENRMLSVEISETSVDLIMIVMDVVASIASFANYLPLANRVR